MKNTCRNCKWFYTTNQQDGECRVAHPNTTVILVPQPPSLVSKGQPTMAPMPIAAFPPIGSPDHIWCGEHEAVLSLAIQ
jgi:hypothetical protein